MKVSSIFMWVFGWLFAPAHNPVIHAAVDLFQRVLFILQGSPPTNHHARSMKNVLSSTTPSFQLNILKCSMYQGTIKLYLDASASIQEKSTPGLHYFGAAAGRSAHRAPGKCSWLEKATSSLPRLRWQFAACHSRFISLSRTHSVAI